VPFAIDTTQSAALVAAGTGLVAALVGIVNLAIAFARERPAVKVFARRWDAGRHGQERYIEVVASNSSRRQNTVVAMGLMLAEEDRSWTVEDGALNPSLPAKVEDGEIVTMAWMDQELGQAFYEEKAVIVGCFALDARGNKVRGEPPS
jgi:hypothetical protein